MQMAYQLRNLFTRGKRYSDPRDMGVTLLGPGFNLVPLVEQANKASAVGQAIDLPRGIWCNVAGTANLVFEDGTAECNEVDGVQLQAGFNPLAPIGLVVGGTATGLYAVY